jgi:hypothetical protein
MSVMALLLKSEALNTPIATDGLGCKPLVAGQQRM